MEASQKKVASEQQETQTFKVKHEQALSSYITNIDTEDLRECQASRDAKHLDAEALRAQHGNTERTCVYHITVGDLRTCQGQLDAQTKEAQALRAKHDTTLRNPLLCKLFTVELNQCNAACDAKQQELQRLQTQLNESAGSTIY